MENRKIVSDREQKEWYAHCPLLITRNTITQGEDGTFFTVTMVPCTDKPIGKVEIRTSFTDARRAVLDTVSYTFLPEHSKEVTCPGNAVYAHTTVEAVYNSEDILIWSRDNASPVVLPDAEILWQTDPLYAQLRRECEGIVNPVYRPDTVDGGWRCTCGHINLESSKKCGACRADHDWLISHFDPDFLRERLAVYEEKKAAAPDKKKVNYRNEKMLEDQRKMKLVFAGIGGVILLLVLLFVLIIPSIRYSSAEKALAAGEYDRAAAVFTSLGTFRNADKRAADVVYQQAQSLTGLEKVNMVTTTDCPWFVISEDGVLTLRKEKYTGSWDHFVVPDMVDGIIVRELAKSFFLNCKDMVSVTLSDCIEVLGEQIFFNCESMTTVHFGSGIRTVGSRAFINCFSLTEISIPDTVENISLRAFNSCTNLRKVILGSNITEIPSYLFSCCTSLESVICQAPITKISAFAFSECPNLETFYYAGTADQWADVVIESEGNEILNEINVITAD